MSSINFTDPLYVSQWYLVNSGQRGGSSRLDVNVLPAWQLGFNGSGIRVAVNDDGMDITHPDLVANIEASSVYDSARDTTGSGFVGTDNSHGTVVGSIVGMAFNGIGGVGIAYGATLIPGLAIGAPSYQKLFSANLTSRADVSVNSWGKDPAFAENFGSSGSEVDQAWGAQLIKNATLGRNGLGMITVVSAGNQRSNNADAALSNFTNDKVTISVAATDEFGVVTNYSTTGANNLITAFGGTNINDLEQSMNMGFGIPAADIQGASGYNNISGAAGNYSYQNTGTSYSGPMVGATAALMLQANPNLGFRDVTTILAMSARQTDASNSDWVINGASNWNGTGMHFSRDYGFGLLDVTAAVRLAQSWVGRAGTFTNWVSSSGTSSTASQQIPDNASQSLLVSARLTDAIQIERVEVDLGLTADAPSQLKAELTSPSGTTITLFNRPLTREVGSSSSSSETPWPGVFTIGVTGFLGESSAGMWNLRLIDLERGSLAQFNSLTIRAWGSSDSPDSQYVFTNEYSRTQTISDANGTDTLNAAAVSQGVTLDLSKGIQSQIANTALIISSSTTIENATGGAGNDILTGNVSNNRLRGNEGDDTIAGGVGIDTAIFSGLRSQYSLSAQSAGGFRVTDSVAFRNGTDTVSGVERLQFSDTSLAIDLDGNAGKVAKILGAIFGQNAVSNKSYVGIGLGYLDSGISYDGLAALAVSATGKSSSTDVCNLLWTNVVKTTPTVADIAPFKAMLDTGQMSIGSLATLAADTSFNITNISLVGLSQTGLEYV